jgi:hypothetical protein
MNNIIDIRVLLKHFVQSCLVSNVQLVEDWSLSAQKLDAVEDFF